MEKTPAIFQLGIADVLDYSFFFVTFCGRPLNLSSLGPTNGKHTETPWLCSRKLHGIGLQSHPVNEKTHTCLWVKSNGGKQKFTYKFGTVKL